MFIIPFADNNPNRRYPVLTVLLILVNVGIFFATWHGDFKSIVGKYALVPAEPTLTALIAHQFLHGGYMHLISNMWFLWLFGDNVEDLVGKIAFIPFYLLSGICAAALHIAVAGGGRGAEVPMVGASGAIFGILGAYFVIFSKSKIKCLVLLIVFPVGMVEAPALFFLGLFLALEVVNGLMPAGLYGVGVAHWAHIGGFLFGAGVIWLLIATRAVLVPSIERVRRGEYATMDEEERFLGRLAVAYEKKSFGRVPEEYRQVLGRNPTIVFTPEKQMQVARAVQSAGDLPLAADAWRKIMDCYPGHPAALRAGIEIAKISFGFFRDGKNAVAYLEWVRSTAVKGPLATEAENMIARIRSGGSR